MSLLNGIKIHFIMISDHSAQREPLVIEFYPTALTSQRAGKGDCGIPSPNIP